MKNGPLFVNLIKTMTAVENEEEMKDLLFGLCTPKEINGIVNRLEIVKQLKKGIPQHKIAKNLGVGVATVTRGSREIKAGRFKNV